MKPQYITLVGTTPKIVQLDTNVENFQLSIRAGAGITTEFALEDQQDATVNPPSGSPGPTWVAPPNAVNANGVLHVTNTPYRLVRFTPTSGGAVTLLQQGLR